VDRNSASLHLVGHQAVFDALTRSAEPARGRSYSVAYAGCRLSANITCDLQPYLECDRL
jgi:hypothetical protein